MKTRRLLRSHGLIYRIARPFLVLALLAGILGAGELSSAIATEFLSDEEAQLARLLNEERIDRGLPALAPSDGLRTIARRHSQRMMLEGTIFHSTTLANEVSAIFPNWASIGENVGVSPSVQSVHTAFMNSPGHRSNILDPDWGYLGIGIVASSSRMFSTENFLELQAGATRPLPVVTRLSGPDRFATSRAIADYAFLARSAAGAVVADGRDFHGALAGASLAGSMAGPVVLTESGGLTAAAQAAIDRVLSSGGEVVAVGAGSIPGASRLIDGADAAAVAADVARALPTRPSRAFVATIESYPDALAASAVSAVTGWPVLYTEKASLSAATRTVLTQLGVSQVYIVGGTGSVSATVASQISGLGIATQRLAGSDRYATAVAVADFGLANGLRTEQVIVATGRNFPDALSAGGAAGVLRAPVLLTDPSVVPAATADWLRRHGGDVDAILVAGGVSAVSDAVAAQLPQATR